MGTIETIDATAWRSWSRERRVEALLLGGCMPWQGRDDSRPGERMSWGSKFRFGNSPVPGFALEGEPERLREALELGACPFARDSEGDGAASYALRGLGSGQPQRVAQGAAVLSMCMEFGAPLLDPSSPLYLGESEARSIKFDLANDCVGAGAYGAALDAGIPIDLRWLVALAPSLPHLSPSVLAASDARTARALREAGLDMLSAIEVASGEPPASVWEWIEDGDKDPLAVAAELLAAGNDPRRPLSDGSVPLEAMLAEPRQARVAAFAQAWLLARSERDELATSALPARPAARPRI